MPSRRRWSHLLAAHRWSAVTPYEPLRAVTAGCDAGGMTSRGENGPRLGLERTAVAASLAQTARYRASYEELRLMHRELVAEAARLAAQIEERLSPRSE